MARHNGRQSRQFQRDRRFQDYGSGKAKLYSRILEELPSEARSTDFEDALVRLRRVSHNDGVLDHRVVDTSDSFAGKSLRAMAEECGLLDLYRHAYQVSSGIVHSEWWAVELHAMERCLNVLHRGHLIPSLSLDSGGSVAIAQAWIDQLRAMIRISFQILGTDQASVDEAFSWLEDETS